MWASAGVDWNQCSAKLASFFFGVKVTESINLFDHQKDDERDNKKVDERVQKRTEGYRVMENY